MSIEFICMEGAPFDYTVRFTNDKCRAVEPTSTDVGGVITATLYLPIYTGDLSPLRLVLDTFFERAGALGVDELVLEAPVHLGYDAAEFTALLADRADDLSHIYIRLDEPILPRNRALADFAKTLLGDRREAHSPFAERSIAPMPSPSRMNAPLHHASYAMRAPKRSPEQERAASARAKALAEELAKKADGFSRHLFALIDARGLDDVTCYKRANLDRKVFSKIRCRENYLPSKPTALALALALRLDLEETEALLKSAGLALSPASDFDIIIRHCIENGIYDVLEINEVLFYYDQPLLGS